MGITFSSPEIPDAHDAFGTFSSFTESYAFAATDTNNFGIPASITAYSAFTDITPILGLPLNTGRDLFTCNTIPVADITGSVSILCPGVTNSYFSEPGLATLSFQAGNQFGEYTFEITTVPIEVVTVNSEATVTTGMPENTATTTSYLTTVTQSASGAARKTVQGHCPRTTASGVYPSGYMPSGYMPSGYMPSGYMPSGSGIYPSSSGPKPSGSGLPVYPSGSGSAGGSGTGPKYATGSGGSGSGIGSAGFGTGYGSGTSSGHGSQGTHQPHPGNGSGSGGSGSGIGSAGFGTGYGSGTSSGHGSQGTHQPHPGNGLGSGGSGSGIGSAGFGTGYGSGTSSGHGSQGTHQPHPGNGSGSGSGSSSGGSNGNVGKKKVTVVVTTTRYICPTPPPTCVPDEPLHKRIVAVPPATITDPGTGDIIYGGPDFTLCSTCAVPTETDTMTVTTNTVYVGADGTTTITVTSPTTTSTVYGSNSTTTITTYPASCHLPPGTGTGGTTGPTYSSGSHSGSASSIHPPSTTLHSSSTSHTSSHTTSASSTSSSCGPDSTAVANPNPPAGSICGTDGLFTGNSVDEGGAFGVASADDCATLCLQTPDCETFSYNVDFGELCDLYGNTLAEGGFDPNAIGGVPFYDRACFVCAGASAGKRSLGQRRAKVV